MLEFNTPISSTAKEWGRNLDKAMMMAFNKIPPTLRADISAVMRFDLALLDCPQAQTFGCEPDFNAWTMEQNPRPTPTDPSMRTAAAHIHLSWKGVDDMLQRCRVIQFADIFATLPSLWESKDKERRQLYGRAGAFRPKEYGVEHRVMDNYWLDSHFHRRIWDRYIQALHAANTPFEISERLATRVQEIINNYKVEEAQSLHKELSKAILNEETDAHSLVKKFVTGGTAYNTQWIVEPVAIGQAVVLDDLGLDPARA